MATKCGVCDVRTIWVGFTHQRDVGIVVLQKLALLLTAVERNCRSKYSLSYSWGVRCWHFNLSSPNVKDFRCDASTLALNACASKTGAYVRSRVTGTEWWFGDVRVPCRNGWTSYVFNFYFCAVFNDGVGSAWCTALNWVHNELEKMWTAAIVS